MSFGSMLKSLRIEHNLTQSELAKKIKLSKANVSKYEAGLVEPSLETLTLIANLFNVSTDYLLGQTDIKNPSAENSEGVGENIVTFSRDGVTVTKKLTADDLATVARMIELLPEDDNPDL